MIINADIRCNERYLLHEPCVVGKTITITGTEFDQLSQSLLEDNAIITENAEHMGYENNMHRCLLIVSDERQDGILVASEGYNYARYTAYVPNAQDILLARRTTQEMRKLLTQVPVIVDEIVSSRKSEIDLNALEMKHGVELVDSMMALGVLGKELCGRPEIDSSSVDEDSLHVTFVEQAQDVAPKGPEMEM